MKKKSILDFINFNENRFTKNIILKEEKTTVFTLNFLPGQSLPAHKHPGFHLQIFVLEGEGLFTFDEEEVTVKKGDVLYVTSEEELYFLNNSSSSCSICVVLNRL